MLQIADVTFAYPRRTAGARVLDRVSFDVERGTIVGLLGPNGAGKTTLLRMMSGILRPCTGRVLIDGRPLNAERGTTMIVSTHDLNLAAALCTRVVLLKNGRVVAQGETQDTLTAQNIRRLYDVDADVQFHSRAGHLTVVPIARAH